MAKEEYETPLIDDYNRTHMDALHEDGSWYHRYLPEGVFLEDLGQIIEEELIKASDFKSSYLPNSLQVSLSKTIESEGGKSFHG